MNLLSSETEIALIDNMVELCNKHIARAMESQYAKAPYIQQKELLEELNINPAYLKKLEAHGLKRIKIDPNDRTVFYKRADVYKMFDRLAE